MKKFYESYIILDGNLEDTVVEDVISKYDAYFKKNDVEVKAIDRMGRRRMAYAIQKKQNGFYICFEFLANPDFLAKLDRAYRLDEGILRYLTIYVSPRTLKEKEDYLRKKAQLIAKIEEEKNAEVLKEEIVIEEIPEETEIEKKEE